MGRPIPTKLVPKFYLRTDRKADKNGRYSIYIDYHIGTKHARTDTKIWVEEKHWNHKNQQISSSHPFAEKLNRELERVRLKIDSRILDYSAQHRINIHVLRDLVQDRPLSKSVRSKDDFIEFAKRVITEEYKLGKIGIAVKDNAFSGFNRFKKFLRQKYGEDSLYIEELTVDVVRQYIFWRQGEGNTNQTINKALTPIIKAAKRAASENLIDTTIPTDLSRLYFSNRLNPGDEDLEEVNYLTDDQLKEFASLYNKVKYPRTKDYIDMFMFSFYACGLRVSDLITLEWKSVDMENREIRKVIIKGGRIHTIPLNDGAISILKRWQDRGNRRFVFGLLDDKFDLSDDSEVKRVRINKNRAILTSLKTLGDKINLSFNLTMHVARHTFAVMALNRGVEVHKISRLMGHTSVLTTEKVYAKFLPSNLEDEVMEKLNFDF